MLIKRSSMLFNVQFYLYCELNIIHNLMSVHKAGGSPEGEGHSSLSFSMFL